MSRGPRFADRLDHLAALLGAALTAANPATAVQRTLRLDSGSICIAEKRLGLAPGARVFLIALGKAAPTMASAAAAILGDRLAAGVVTELVPSGLNFPPHVLVIRAGHPLPDQGSLRAGSAMLDLAAQGRRGDIVLVLVSGGGSAMAEALRSGIRLEDLRLLTTQLLLAGAPIASINGIRGALSELKRGGLACAAAPAQVIGLLLSDVVGDDPASIASGPTVLQPDAPGQARRTLERLGLWTSAPPTIREALSQAPSPQKADPHPVNLVIARNATMLAAVDAEASRLGFPVRVLTERMQGEASTIGARLGRRLRQASPPACLLAGGETTVTLRRGGQGGRNQELALSAALSLTGADRSLLAAFASDGIDGPTDAAGSWVDGHTIERARSAGFDARQALEAHDVYPLFEQLDALLLTGPTGTNLNDLVIGLTYDS